MPDPKREPQPPEPACQPAAGGGIARSTGVALLPHLDFPPDPELVAQGWQRRFMADPMRAKEAIQLYTELGFEVRTEPIKSSELSQACGDCRLATCLAYVTVYTRLQTRPES